MTPAVSVVLPAKNEAQSLRDLLPKLRQAGPDWEIIVSDDGSTDDTAAVCADAGVRHVRRPYSSGNGAAIKAGVRAAQGKTLVLMDADGQHRPDQIALLLTALEQGYELAVGSRSQQAHASFARRLANAIYNRLASWLTGTPIIDLTSGFRAARHDQFRDLLPLLPNGFSYPTTSTMAYLRAGLPVAFVPVEVDPRSGDQDSHIRPLQDGSRFFAIIFKVATLYSPLKVFLPVSLGIFTLALVYYTHTFLTDGRFTNMGVALLLSSVFVALIGMVSEQVATLIHLSAEPPKRDSDGG